MHNKQHHTTKKTHPVNKKQKQQLTLNLTLIRNIILILKFKIGWTRMDMLPDVTNAPPWPVI